MGGAPARPDSPGLRRRAPGTSAAGARSPAVSPCGLARPRPRNAARPPAARRARAWYSGPCLRGSAYSLGLIVQYVPLVVPYQLAPPQSGSNGPASAPSYDVEPSVALLRPRPLRGALVRRRPDRRPCRSSRPSRSTRIRGPVGSVPDRIGRPVPPAPGRRAESGRATVRRRPGGSRRRDRGRGRLGRGGVGARLAPGSSRGRAARTPPGSPTSAAARSGPAASG